MPTMDHTPADHARIVARRKTSGLEYVAWRNKSGGMSFTINDGRVPGSTAAMYEDEFWQIFQKVRDKKP